MEAGGGDWGICGVTQRSRTVLDQLEPQDGLYTVLARGPHGVEARVVGTERELLFAGSQADQVVARAADPAVRVVTLTVTEKGYRHNPATGRLRRDDDSIRADLAGGSPQTVLGQLVRGMQARMVSDSGPLAVLSCDNLNRNGATVAGLVTEFVDLLPVDEARHLASWIAEQVRFPSSSVDRIVPAATAADYDEVRRQIGLDDEGVVVTEPFRQWVIEDDFPGGRPSWEAAGVLLTDDVTPYEVMKLRMLNGAHSTLAYLGALAGCETIADAMSREPFAAVVQRLMHYDVRTTLQQPTGFDLAAYEDQLLDRFANPALQHRTAQVAMDGSHKVPQRLLSTFRARRAAGAEPRWAAFAVAAWMRWVWSDRTDEGVMRVLEDPLSALFQDKLSGASSPSDVVARLLAIRDVFGNDLCDDEIASRLLVDALELLTGNGALGAATLLEHESTPNE